MNKSNVLLIGVGQAGNNIVDEIYSTNDRFATLYINTAINDITNLKHVQLDRNLYLIPNASGAGKDRNTAKDYIKEKATSLLDLVNQYPLQKVVYIFFSMGGGSGSGMSPAIIKMIKKYCSDKIINIVAILPDLYESNRIMQNAVDCWNDIIKISDYANSIFLVDNSKRETHSQINKQIAKDLVDSMSLKGVDDSDLTLIHTAKGSSAIYRLNDKIYNVKDALDKAIQESIYIMPNTIYCNRLGVGLSKDNINFTKEKLLSLYTATDISIVGESEDNLLIVGGCNISKEGIEYISLAIQQRNEELSKNQKNVSKNELLMGNIEVKKEEVKSKDVNILKESINITKSIDDIINDGFFDDLF